jgi:hypothetical protein
LRPSAKTSNENDFLSNQPKLLMTTDPTTEKSPDDLMRHFHGRSLKGIIIFTVIFHAIVLIGGSVPYLWNTFGKGTANLSEEERFKLAAQKADAALRAIAEEHGVKPQDLGDRLAGGAPKSTSPATAPAATPATPATPDPATPAPPAADAPAAPGGQPAAPASAIEKEIEKAVPGPTVPGIQDDEDLFK